jgi:hypothetical protein
VVTATTHVPFFHALHKPWFQMGETCEFNGNIRVFLLEGGEEI